MRLHESLLTVQVLFQMVAEEEEVVDMEGDQILTITENRSDLHPEMVEMADMEGKIMIFLFTNFHSGYLVIAQRVTCNYTTCRGRYEGRRIVQYTDLDAPGDDIF